ncbi:hypothetical protein KCP70_17915 [Salmonella enterica subsp. enterica]|nr:hypothetical protein KCP70_17915 [Salmonella enterica subsp. enterica]
MPLLKIRLSATGFCAAKRLKGRPRSPNIRGSTTPGFCTVLKRQDADSVYLLLVETKAENMRVGDQVILMRNVNSSICCVGKILMSSLGGSVTQRAGGIFYHQWLD